MIDKSIVEKCPFCDQEISWPVNKEVHAIEFFPNTATYARAHKTCIPEKGFRAWLDEDWNADSKVGVSKIKKTKKKT